MNLLTQSLPETVTVDGGEYAIFTDYRNWIQFSEMMLDDDLTNDEKYYLAMGIFKEEPQSQQGAIQALTEFYLLGEKLKPTVEKTEEELKEEEKEETPPPMFNWSVDSAYILGGFLEHYSIDLMTIKYMHWWKFKALFNNIVEFKLEERIDYRALNLSKIKDKDERARLSIIKNKLRLKQVVSDEEIGGAFS